MKIRNGLVSNSSTSSYVLFGYHIKMEAKEIVKILMPQEEIDEDFVWDYIHNGIKIEGVKQEFSGFDGRDIEKDGIIFGIQPMHIGEYESKDAPLKLSAIGKALNTLAEKLGLDKRKKRVFGGIMAC